MQYIYMYIYIYIYILTFYFCFTSWILVIAKPKTRSKNNSGPQHPSIILTQICQQPSRPVPLTNQPSEHTLLVSREPRSLISSLPHGYHCCIVGTGTAGHHGNCACQTKVDVCWEMNDTLAFIFYCIFYCTLRA